MTPFKKLSLRSKLLLIIISTHLIVLTTVGVFIYYEFRDFLYTKTEIRIKQNLILAELLLDARRFSPTEAAYLKSYANRISSVLEARVTVMDAAGVVLADSDVPQDEIDKVDNHLNRPEVQQAIAEGWGFSVRESRTIHRKLIYVCKALHIENNEKSGFVRLGLDYSEADQMLKGARTGLIGAGILVIIFSIVLIFLMSHRMNRHLRQLINNAQLIATGKFDDAVEIGAHDELQELNGILIQMSQRLSQSLQEITRQSRDLNEMLSSINDGIIAIGSDKRVLFYNEVSVRLFNFISGDIRGKFYYGLFLNKHLVSLMDRFFQKPFVISDEIALDENRILEVVINPFKAGGKASESGAVLVARDVTHYKKLERIRRDFVANVSHEFKNPLASIQGYAETLLDWAMDDPKVNRKYLEKIVKQAGNLENLVTDLLQLARVEGLQSIELKTFDPLPILNELKLDFAELTTAKRIDFALETGSQPLAVRGDPEMFRTIMANLISNAIKYTPEGGEVVISARIADGFIEFSVADSGIGIPRKYLSRIFERFFRVDKGRSREAGGTGLGLSIVKHMAELQQAKYGVESEIGEGSRFWVRFKKG